MKLDLWAVLVRMRKANCLSPGFRAGSSHFRKIQKKFCFPKIRPFSFRNEQRGVSIFVFFLIVLLSNFSSVLAANRFSVATGNWNATSTWSATSGGAPGAAVPVAGDVVTIEGGFTVTVNANTANLGSLTVSSGSTLIIPNRSISVGGATYISGAISFASTNGTKTFTGDVTLNNGAVWNETVAAAMTFGGSFTNNATTFTSSTGVHTFSGTTKTLSGSTATVIPRTAITGTYTNNGTLTVNTALSGAGSLTNSNSLNIGGTCSISTLNNSGTISVSGTGAISTALASFTNTGTINLSGSGNIAGITNNAAGIVNLASSGTITSFNNATATSTLNISAITVPTITTLSATAVGNTVNYNGAGNQTVKATTYNNLTFSGSGAKNFPGATTVNGILSMQGSATATGTAPTYGGSATLEYKGSIAQTTGIEFPAPFNGSGGVIINNPNGVVLGGAETIGVASKLTLTGGTVTTSAANLLTISNTAVTAISGGSATSYIDGPVIWTLPASMASGSTYTFPVGKGGAYLPFDLVNPTTGTGTVTAQAEAFNTNSGGSPDGTTTASLSNTEYWSLSTAGNFTNSSVSIARPLAISPMDVIGACATVGGNYTSLAGTVGTNGITNSNLIGANRFFAFAGTKLINTITINGTPFCAGATGVSVPFTYSLKANFNSATFTAQLSDATGSFASPVTLQSVASNGSGSQSLTVTIPAGTPAGTGYRIRIVSTNPATTGSDNGVDLVISSGVPAQPGAITGSSSPCANATGLTYSVPNVSGVTYTWSLPTGWTQTGGGSTNSITVTSGSSAGNIQVTPSNACGSGTAQTLAVSTVAGPSFTTQPSTSPQSLCQNATPTALSVAANGATSYQWYVNGSSSNTGGTLISGATSTSYTPSTASTGTLYYYCVASGTCPPSAVSNVSGAVTVIVPPALVTTSASRCGTGTVTLSATSSSCLTPTITWFAALTGGTSLGTGTSFTTPTISTTTTYYAQENFTGGLTPIGGVTANTNNSGLVFDLSESIVLNSVQISASGAASSTTIALRDNAGNAVAGAADVVLTPVAGTQTVTLNWTIPAGTGYRLLKTAGTMNLAYTNAYSTWPTGFNVGSITNSYQNGTVDATRYNYFYNWSISRVRVAATATIGAPTVVGFAGGQCGTGSTSVTLGATTTAGTINWYTASTGGSPVATGASYTPSISATTTFYVSATDGTCTSSPRIAVVASLTTPPTVTATGGGTYCSGSTVNLTSTTAASNLYWTGPNGFYSLSNNPTLTNVTAAMSGVYTVTASSLSGVNLVTNGDFESGNIGFGSSYVSSNDLVPEGRYAVVANPNSVHTGFTACGDHTSGSGLQMVVNGATAANVNIWSQTVNVVPNKDYQFTYWVQSVVASNPSQLQLYINGSPAGPVYTADLATCSWRQFTYNWNSGSSTSAYLSLVNQNTIAGGNDFALDDIVFQQACSTADNIPKTPMPGGDGNQWASYGVLVVTVNDIPTTGAIGSDQGICTGDTPAMLTSTTAGTGSGTVTYEWQTNASGSFVTIPGATAATYSPPPLISTTSYQRRTVATNNGVTCYSGYTTPVTITVSGPTAVAGGPDVVCQSSSPLPITLSGASFGGGATSAAWSIISGGGALSSYAQTTTPATVTYTPSANYSGSVTLRLTTAGGGGCAAIANRTITVTPTVGTPSFTLGATSTICQGAGTVTYTASASNSTGITYSLDATTLAFTGNSINSSNGTVTYAAGWSGTSTITASAAGCNGPATATHTVTITSTPVATFSYNGPYCSSAANPLPTFNGGGTAGTFSSTAGLNFVSTATGQINLSTSTPGTYTVTNTIAAAGGCSVTSATSSVTINLDGSWNGSVNTDWNTPGNWDCNQLPTLTTNVLIAAAKPRYPANSTGATDLAKNLTIQNGASVTVAGNTLKIAGVISNSGTFTASAGTIEMAGSAAQTIPANTFTGNTIMNLSISNAAGVTLGGALNITGIVTPLVGTLNSGGTLTLVSTATQTALIDGSGSGSVTGNVTMQRYLPSAYGYKYFSSPFSNATVAQFSVYLSTTATIPKFYFYDENHQSSGADMTGWTEYTTGALPLNVMQGYAANLGANATPATISLAGTVNNGSYAATLYNHNRTYTQGFNLVGNPYPSPIDWDAASGWAKTNIDNALYFFDSTGATDEYSGSYSSYVNGLSTGGSNNIIPSMQGFFVHVTDGTFPVTGTLGLTNSVRTNALNPTFKSAYIDPRPILRLEARFDDKSNRKDAFVLYFDPIATAKFDKDADALKLMNTDEQVPNLYAFTTDSRQVSIDGIAAPTDSLTRIPLGLTTYRDGWLNILAKEIVQLPSAMNIYLNDRESGFHLDLKQNPVYRVYLKKGKYNQRFELVLSTGLQPLPRYEIDHLLVLTRSGGNVLAYVNLGQGGSGSLLMYNLSGQKVFEALVVDQQTVDISSGTPSGIYVVTVRSGKRTQSEKTLIRKE